MPRVLVVATGRKTRGGITSVIKAYEATSVWSDNHCFWIQTHKDGSAIGKIVYFVLAVVEFLLLLPFYDIVHCHCALGTSGKRKLFFVRIAKLYHKKVIVHFHPSSKELLFQPENHNVGYSLFSKADVVIVLSPQWARWIDEAYPGNSFCMKVLWNPCPKVIRNLENRKLQILYAGTLIKRKGYDVLLHAFAQISNKYPYWRLVFAGNPYLLDGVNELDLGKQIAASEGISSQVEWVGWVSGVEKERLFQESAIFCLPSEGEGFPMGVLDAWAYGLPCVLTPVGGIPDVVQNGMNALLFPVGDSVALASQLDRLMSNSEFCKQIVRESDQLVHTTFNIVQLAGRLNTIYNELSN